MTELAGRRLSKRRIWAIESALMRSIVDGIDTKEPGPDDYAMALLWVQEEIQRRHSVWSRRRLALKLRRE